MIIDLSMFPNYSICFFNAFSLFQSNDANNNYYIETIYMNTEQKLSNIFDWHCNRFNVIVSILFLIMLSFI